MSASGLIGTKESDLGFPVVLWHASLAHAQRYILCRIFPRPSAIASDRRGPQEPSETRMAGAYRASEWR